MTASMSKEIKTGSRSQSLDCARFPTLYIPSG
jgi:hypothetical protein